MADGRLNLREIFRADGGTGVVVDNGLIRGGRLFDINAFDGVDPTGTTECSAAIRAGLALIPDGSVVRFRGDYLCRVVKIDTRARLTLDLGDSTFTIPDGANLGSNDPLGAGGLESGKMIWIYNSEDITVEKGYLYGNRYNVLYSPADGYGTSRYVGACSITAGTTALTTTSGGFLATDVGERVLVFGAGVGGKSFETTIAAYVSTSEVTLSDAAVTTVAGVSAVVSVNDGHCMGIQVQNSPRTRIEGTKIYDFATDGLYCSDYDNLRMQGVISEGNRRQAWSLIDGTDVRAVDCDFGYSYGTNPEAGLDIEPNTDASDIELIGCRFNGGEKAVKVTLLGRDVRLIGCHFNGFDYILGNEIYGDDVQFIGCTFRTPTGSSSKALFIAGKRVLVQSCQFPDVTGDAEGVIRVKNPAEDVVIDNCGFENPFRAIYDSGIRTRITNNRVKGNTSQAYYLDGTGRGLFSGNTQTGASTGVHMAGVGVLDYAFGLNDLEGGYTRNAALGARFPSTFGLESLRNESWATAIPTEGTWGQGDVVRTLTPSTASPVTQRVCRAAGTPGTWNPISWIVGKGNTATRPALGATDVGVMYLDTQLVAAGKPIWWTGTAWVDATGAVV